MDNLHIRNLDNSRTHQNCLILKLWSLNTRRLIYSIKILSFTVKSLTKILIECYSNNLKENEEVKEVFEVEFIEQKDHHENNYNPTYWI